MADTRGIPQFFRLLGKQAGLSLAWILRDRKSAILWMVASLVINIAAISGTFLLAEQFDGIGDWSKHQITFMLGYTVFVNSILGMFFGYNILMISRRIGRGQLDHVLLQPQPLWRTLATEGFTPFDDLLLLPFSIGLMCWSGSNLPVAKSPLWFGLFAVNILGSAAVALAFQFIWGSLAFWAPQAAEEINSSTNRALSGLNRFPLDPVHPMLTGLLLSVVPVGFSGWFPVRELGGLHPIGFGAIVTPIAGAVFMLIAVFVFRKGLSHYATVGSQRYLDFGHRR